MTFLEAIQTLGETPESVMTALRSKGISGYMRMAGDCPVARYLKAMGFPNVTVASTASCYSNPECHHADQTHHLPAGVKQWITDFDDGKYPEFWLT